MPGANPSGLSRGSKGVSPLDNYVVTTKRVLINYAQRHVKPGANPSGAVAPPPLAGEAFPVGERERVRFTGHGHARRHIMPGANPSGAVAPPPLAGEAFLVGERERGRFTPMHDGTSCPAPTPPALSRHLPLHGRLFLSENVSAVVLQAMHHGLSSQPFLPVFVIPFLHNM